MARNVAVTSLLVALCFVAVAGHGRYGHGGGFHGGGLGGGVHGGVLGGGVHGGVLGGGVHGVHTGGLGLAGSGVHGAGSFNPAYYPGLLPGFGFHVNRPTFGYNKCKYWCRSSYTRQYYCCQQSYYG
ncbi:glycine-rich cell wall structural protein-like [Penaeus monodon]|uniref:glycine-rich cell wall structural protein-like n=1 Tax=Penaeus monodon TaxID=6687 RepID=UPI0018A78781|nr:glycine-rich cell wall structural protein-like [Penaeus monodon]